jgi:hypothetical protein
MIFLISLCCRNRNATPEGQTQKESPGFSFLTSFDSRSPGLNLFESSVFDSATSSDQVKWEAEVLFLKIVHWSFG